MLAGLLVGGGAHAVVIDFNSTPSTTYNTGEYFEAGGFRFERGPTGQMTVLTNCGFSGCSYDGSNFLFIWNLDTTLNIRRTDNAAFSLNGFDAAEGGVGQPTWWAHTLQLTATLAGGGTVSTSFTMDLINDGTGGTADFQSFVLPGSFSNIVALTIRGSGGTTTNDYAIDNLNVGAAAVAVPEPMTLALSGIGVAGLVSSRSRRVRRAG